MVARNNDPSLNVQNAITADEKSKYDPPTTVKILRTRQQNTFCRTAVARVEYHSLDFAVQKKGFLLRRAHIDGAIQIFLPP